MKKLMFICLITLFSSLAFAGSASVGDGYAGYSAIHITSMDGLIGGDDSAVADAVIIDSDSKSYPGNYNILQTKPTMKLGADKTGIGVLYSAGLWHTQTMTRYSVDEVGWRRSF